MMAIIPNTLNDIDPAATLLFNTMHVAAAEKVFRDGWLPVLGDMLANRQTVTLGVERFNRARAARRLPYPWSGSLKEFVLLEMTPCTRAAFASVTGQNGAVQVDRREIVSICISHDEIRTRGGSILYVDRLCTRDDALFSGDSDLLRSAAWDRIRSRDFRPDTGNPAAVHHYDAAVLVRGALPISVVNSIICKDDGMAEAFCKRCPVSARRSSSAADCSGDAIVSSNRCDMRLRRALGQLSPCVLTALMLLHSDPIEEKAK